MGATIAPSSSFDEGSVRSVMRVLLTAMVWLVTTAILAPVCFFGTMILAGPHSSMLPSFIQPAILLLAWLVFLAGPAAIARLVWRRHGSRRIIGAP
jgi:hypothetical protein